MPHDKDVEAQNVKQLKQIERPEIEHAKGNNLITKPLSNGIRKWLIFS